MNARPTTIRLDQPTLDRAATLRDAQRVPVSLSAVLQEAIRRGLGDMERETVRYETVDLLEFLTPVDHGDTELKFRAG